MPLKIVPIVEGDGEVEGCSTLLRKIFIQQQRYDIEIIRGKNAAGRDNLLKPGGIEKFVTVAVSEPECVGIVVLLDAERDCPVTLAKDLANRVKTLGMQVPVVIVCAKHMYEAWFLASLDTIAGRNIKGRPGIPDGLRYNAPVEDLRNPKNWLESQMPNSRKYRESEDQAALTAMLDFELVRQRSRSFRRLLHAVQQLLDAIDNGQTHVTP